MLKNYLVTALRHISKNRVYATINVLGLVVGLVVFVFGNLLVSYERSHDTMYENYQRTYVVNSIFSDTANMPVKETDGVYTAAAPFVISDVPELEQVARTVRWEFLVSVEDAHYYQSIRFVDPSFLEIFDFEYVEGDNSALSDPSGLLITQSSARKFFGTSPAMGQLITLDHETPLRVSAVVKDLPPNTHFNSAIIGTEPFEVVASLAALGRANGYDIAGNWSNLSAGDLTYILLPEGKDEGWLRSKIDGVYESHMPEDSREMIAGFSTRPLIEVNTLIWDALNLPVMTTVQLLALLVLIVAIVNYTNLATAQSLSRAKEVGLRKTMGAGRKQLLVQFLVESLCTALFSMLIAIVLLEMIVPLFNENTGKGLTIEYISLLPWLLLTTLMVGLVSGAYPAYLITKTTPVEALHNEKRVGGSLFRSVMLGLQFSISIFMLALVLIVFLQNKKLFDAADIFPRSEIVTLKRLQIESIQQRLGTFRNELMQVDGIQDVAYSSHVPFDGSNFSFMATPEQGNETRNFRIRQVVVDENFLPTYDIPLLAGRNFSSDVSGDYYVQSKMTNVMVNELALLKLGLPSGHAAIDNVFYEYTESREPSAFKVVGVFPDQNFQGFHNKIKPTVFVMKEFDASQGRGDAIQFASIRVSGAAMNEVLPEINARWDALIPEYPIQVEYLNETFDKIADIYGIFSEVLGGFAFVAFTLSMIGLFGLAAFIAESKTREIGIRKVMGASVLQVVRLMIWKFSQPVVWALLVSLPGAYLASRTYTDFFADRLSVTGFVVVFAGVLAVGFSWAVVAAHAIKIAKMNPIGALRHE